MYGKNAAMQSYKTALRSSVMLTGDTTLVNAACQTTYGML
jgi:hypothetical protein